jgi:hypothetical protein
MRPSAKVRTVALASAVALLGVAPGALARSKAGFLTSQPSMLMPVAPGATATPIITVGETLAGGYRFEAIPDGISLRARGQGRVDVFVNHETSTVPFPYTPSAPTEANSQNDFDNSQVSQLTLNQRSGGVLRGSLAIASAENFQRFCSNYLATQREGFDRPILFTNEEAIDWINRSGKAWPATIGADEARQAGVAVAYDVRTGQAHPIWGMGRHNHENSVAIPGYDELVVLSSDDTFVSNPVQSQLYSYVAGADGDNRGDDDDDGDDDDGDDDDRGRGDTRALLNDEGDLWAFVSDTPGFDDYYDFTVGSTASITGHFIKVPKDIATGRNPDGTDMMSFDVGYPPPPNDGTWQRDPNGIGIDGPQWVLEHWGDLNGVFQFVRLEDIAYDKRRGMGNVVYIADTGRGATTAGGNPFTSTNGRIWKMVLDPNDPTKVTSLSILIEGDDNPVKTLTEFHQPDNLETTRNSLLIQEDPGSSQQFPPGSTDPNTTTARIWRYDLATGTMSVVATVDQSTDEGSTDVDSATAGNLGAWESSGIVDASSVFGRGAFLVTVQAHTLWVQKAPGDDNVAPPGPDFTFKREGGQLVLLRLPGA